MTWYIESLSCVSFPKTSPSEAQIDKPAMKASSPKGRSPDHVTLARGAAPGLEMDIPPPDFAVNVFALRSGASQSPKRSHPFCLTISSASVFDHTNQGVIETNVGHKGGSSMQGCLAVSNAIFLRLQHAQTRLANATLQITMESEKKDVPKLTSPFGSH
jgi:hypothetical protein